MKIMTRMGTKVLDALGNDDFVRCVHSVGLPRPVKRDDIAWMKFGEDGRLYAINPEAGFFGVAPGTSNKTNPMAMASFQKNSIFTNVAETADGEYFWEGLEKELKEKHGILVGALVKSEATAAAEHTGKQSNLRIKVMHDPMAMRPFMGYNFGRYLQHWINLGKAPHKLHRAVPSQQYIALQVPKIFHVNWFRETKDHKFLWPGYGDNIRVLDWILKRVDGVEDIARCLQEETPIGYIPKRGSVNLDGLPRVDWTELMSIPKQYWEEDVEESKHFIQSQVLPCDSTCTVN
ncbi:phosphoenolpyruvate carboxykinase [Ancylostoma ceylanicum]|uniref:phosphoenolpyruvate carboxykinase (GTP) n=1 Tax=Ancylostoma ceylanicum TaxID=53326 RepID=A0A0D6LR25_9BILA|nr:phosphoenolpyruvate carboxykinase [Ancylostoma ceylanicum]